jgi:hypothetical protein
VAQFENGVLNNLILKVPLEICNHEPSFTITQYNKQVLTKKTLQETQLKKLALFLWTYGFKDEYIHFNSELIIFCSAHKLITKKQHYINRNKFDV